jgi:hypothetical protein
MDDEGLADVEAASPFRLPRLHPGIRFAELFQHKSRPRGYRFATCCRWEPVALESRRINAGEDWA